MDIIERIVSLGFKFYSNLSVDLYRAIDLFSAFGLSGEKMLQILSTYEVLE